MPTTPTTHPTHPGAATPAGRVVIVSALDPTTGVTTIAGAATSVDRAEAWLRSGPGRQFVADYGGGRPALREPARSFLDIVTVDQLGAGLDLQF